MSPQVPGSERELVWLMVSRTQQQAGLFCLDVCVQCSGLCVCSREGIVREGVDGAELDFFFSFLISH